MKKIKITSEAWVDMGVYEGETEREALENFARDAGYSSYADLCDSLSKTIEEGRSELDLQEAE